jgi:hypothetical protein
MPYRQIKTVRRVDGETDGPLIIEFAFSNGSKERFEASGDVVSELLLKVSQFNMDGAAEVPETLSPKVSYDPGNGRVAIGIPSKKGTLTLAMGYERAATLGSQLLEAATRSIEPPVTKA